MTKKTRRILLIVVIGCVYLVIAEIFGGNRLKRFYNDFNSTSIYGKLEFVKIAYHGVGFKIKGMKKEFVFFPYTSKINKNNIFNYIAKPGDSIAKPAFSDTLKLVKKDKTYLYTFQK